ncbi:DUF5703 domain-containing protein [Streptomyces canus]|uniref:DUF5703 domain-containing protein n=1 Tax=Streptomyces canus TaxID=58343 RepID=UPI0032544B14
MSTAVPDSSDVVWTTPSRTSAESMPCGGGDIGLNVWAENGDVLFCIDRSGSFDAFTTPAGALVTLPTAGGVAGDASHRAMVGRRT